jgi:predicted transcriptional regulator
MDVNSICNHNVSTVEAHTGIVDAAAQMRAEHVGDLIVVAHRVGRRVPIGILTDRDIVTSVVAKGVSPNDVTVADAMTSGLLKVRSDNGLEFALQEMRRVGVRRAPVVDENDNLIGVITIDDVLDHLAVQLGHIADIVRLGQQAEREKRP